MQSVTDAKYTESVFHVRTDWIRKRKLLQPIPDIAEKHGGTTKTKEGKDMMYFKDCKTIEEVKAAYRKYAKQLHPDCGGNA